MQHQKILNTFQESLKKLASIPIHHELAQVAIEQNLFPNTGDENNINEQLNTPKKIGGTYGEGASDKAIIDMVGSPGVSAGREVLGYPVLPAFSSPVSNIASDTVQLSYPSSSEANKSSSAPSSSASADESIPLESSISSLAPFSVPAPAPTPAVSPVTYSLLHCVPVEKERTWAAKCAQVLCMRSSHQYSAVVVSIVYEVY
jgi:hypothetical protein